MACKYIYKGKQFNSEIELDDFLLEKAPFEPTLGDLVFSMSSAQLNVSNQLSQIAKESHKVKKTMYDAIKAGKVVYDEDGNMAVEDPPYIGVNKFLSGLKNTAGELLFPQFREEEYWSRRYSNWKVGQFTDAEIEEFELDKNNLPKITDPAQHKALREQMTHKWEIQAKTGSAIHNVLQICFQKQNGKYNFELDDSSLKDYIENNLDKKNQEFLTPIAIQQSIEYARKLHQDLTRKFGEGCAYYPEFAVTQDTNIMHNGAPTKLMGIIDLLIIDSSGKPHILDYKTSIHDYMDFSQAKKNAYSYQLATYQRMLEKYGINIYQGELLVAPIQISNFRKEGNTYIYDGINAPESFTSINTSLNTDKMWENIDEFMPAPFKLSITTEEANQTISDMMGKWFPEYSSTKKVTREGIIARLRKLNKLVPNENGEYVYRKYGKESPITATSEAEFVDKVLKYEESLPSKRLRITGQVKSTLKEAMQNGIDNVEFPSPIITESDGSVTWLKDILSPYCNDNWEVVDNELLESYGVIAVKTKNAPNQIDFIRVSTSNLTSDYRRNFGKKNTKIFQERRGITGTYESDVVQKSKSNTLIAEAVQGNVELMETMLLINQMRGIEGYTVGNVQVVNPLYANGLGLSNEELLYCWKELNKHDSVKQDNFKNSTVKFATKYELARNRFANIMREGAGKDWKDGYQLFGKLRNCQTILDENIDSSAEDKIRALKKLLDNLTSTTKKLDKVYTTESEIQSKEVSLHNDILAAIAQLKGVNFRQQLKDHDMFVENLAIWKHGISGTYIDNPGNMDSDTLNLVTKLVTEAYQNVRDDIQKDKTIIHKLVGNLKKEAGFGAITENTIGNQVSLYKNMFQDYQVGGDFLFKNPDQLNGAEKEFLEFALYRINKNRFPKKTEEELQQMRDNNDVEYYRVPLARGSEDSIASTSGLLATLRAKLNYLNPKKAFQIAREKMEGIFNADDSVEQQQKSEILYKMTNMFDQGEDTSKRLDKIQAIGKENLEQNLETLLYKHLFAYSVKNNMDGVFPMIKAAMVHISTQGAIQNRPFNSDTHYLENYIRNKIFNQSIIDPKLQKVAGYAGLLKQAASKFTLAFSPVQALYQPLQGLWTDISLMIRKPDGKDSFTFSHFTKALRLVYSDLSHYSDKPTICSALNELYGINDMDMNTYVERISQAKKGIWNFDNFMFKFASRPDYYNRMTIFTSQMMGDGCLEAHSINDKGELVYDWKQDKRFDAFANGRVTDPKYNEQKSRYYTIARQFVIEHAKNKDGSDFTLNMKNPLPLPRAYTNKQAESMKSLGDDIYGYYSHEKKSLIMSTTIGSLWLQFKTYWSGKKNQYLQSGGVRLRGNWEQYEENGEKYYYQVDDNGNVLFDEPPTTTETSAPVIQWKGQWQEGIILTLADMAKNMWNAGLVDSKGIHLSALKEGWDSKWNNDDANLQLAYRNNIKQGGYDLMMFVIGGCIMAALLGDWLDELKDPKNKDFVQGLGVAAANVAVMSVRNSFLDFNTWDSVGGALSSWTPFSFEWGARTWKNLWNVATGDEDFWDGIVKTSGSLKQIKPALDAIKPDMFRTKREGGTFGQKE